MKKNVKFIVVIILLFFVLIAIYNEYSQIKNNEEAKRKFNIEKQIFGDPNITTKRENLPKLKEIYIKNISFNKETKSLSYEITNNSKDKVFIDNSAKIYIKDTKLYANADYVGNILEREYYKSKIMDSKYKININSNETIRFNVFLLDEFKNINLNDLKINHIIFNNLMTPDILGVIYFKDENKISEV